MDCRHRWRLPFNAHGQTLNILGLNPQILERYGKVSMGKQRSCERGSALLHEIWLMILCQDN